MGKNKQSFREIWGSICFNCKNSRNGTNYWHEFDHKSTQKFTDKNKSLLAGKINGHFGGLTDIPAMQQLPTFRQ